jgi:hypothetical protein
MRRLDFEILDDGAVCVRCEWCGDITVVEASCKRRGFCPSCGGWRMSELAAHLVDRVLPPVPIRQWVFTVPVPVRYQLTVDAGLTRAVLRVYLRTVFGWQRRQAAQRGLAAAASRPSRDLVNLSMPMFISTPLFSTACTRVRRPGHGRSWTACGHRATPTSSSC